MPSSARRVRPRGEFHTIPPEAPGRARGLPATGTVPMRAAPLLLALGLLALPLSLGASLANGACEPEPIHWYGASTSVDVDVAGMASGIGAVWVTDTNAEDCDGDGVVADYDGDNDLGVGGGVFGWGPWADSPECGWRYNVHGPRVHVTDVVLADVPFVLGEDDQDGPIVATDPETGETTCTTSGSITPGEDADDCLTPVLRGSGRTCGTGGGDGVFWVFLNVHASDRPSLTGPTAGTIVAYPDP